MSYGCEQAGQRDSTPDFFPTVVPYPLLHNLATQTGIQRINWEREQVKTYFQGIVILKF